MDLEHILLMQTTSFNEFLNRCRHSASGKWTTNAQYFSCYIGLGNDYNAINNPSYGAQFSLPRSAVNPTLSCKI